MGFPSSLVVKNPPAMQVMQEMWIQSLGQEDPLEMEMATHSSIHAWEIPWTGEPGSLLSIGLFKQEYWRGLPFPSPGDLPDPGIEPASLAWQADSLPLSHQGSIYYINTFYKKRYNL